MTRSEVLNDMKHILNQLIQVQELTFALAEQKATNPQARLEPLAEAIQKLLEKLPEDVAHRYKQLQSRVPLVVVPITHRGCSGCGVEVPIALVHQVRAAEQIHPCPHCGRFLYIPEVLPRRTETVAGRKGPVRAGIARFSAKELMVPKLAAKNREEAIAELAGLMGAHQFIDDADVLIKLALDREAMVSTAVEHGIAFPHVRNVETGSLTLALGLKESGIQWDAPDGHLTKAVFLIVIPTAASSFYLRLLAGLVHTFSVREARDNMLKCDTADDMWKTLTNLTRGTIP